MHFNNNAWDLGWPQCRGDNAANCDIEGDFCCDTPPEATSGYIGWNTPLINCPPSPNTCNELYMISEGYFCSDIADPVDNYMEYSIEDIRTTFTNDQALRMYATLDISRFELVSPVNLALTGVECAVGIESLFGIDNNQPCMGEIVNFNAIYTSPTANYDWDFGDTQIGNGQIVQHTYTTAGNYSATLTVSDNGIQNSNNTQIYVVNCNSPISSSQGNWYFGHYAGLDFSTGVPLADFNARINETIDASEGCVTQSDNNGNLLFYSDGFNVWNADHQRMDPANHELTSFNCGNQYSCVQAALAVPDPSDAKRYYLFTLPSTENYTTCMYNDFFAYSIIDFNNNLLGEVTNINTQIILPASSQIAEHITAIPQCGGLGYWIIVHNRNNQANPQDFFVFSLTAAGLSTAISYNSGVDGDFTGHIKASPDGTKIAYEGNGSVYVYPFDNLTGVISPGTLILSENCRGLSFSPNSNLLYITPDWPYQTSIIQFNLTNFPIFTQTIVANNLPYGWNTLALGPDDKIYVSLHLYDHLGVINYPNITNSNNLTNECGYNFYGPTLTDQLNNDINCLLGLPNMIDAIPSLPLNAFNVTGGGSYCTGAGGVNVGLDGSEIGVSYQLYNNGNSIGLSILGTGNALNFGNQIASGNYTVIASNTTTGCSETMTGAVTITLYPLPIANAGIDQTIYSGQTATLTASGGATYLWSTTETTASINVTPATTTTYTVTVTDANYCSASDEVVVTVTPILTACPADNVYSSQTLIDGSLGTWAINASVSITGTLTIQNATVMIAPDLNMQITVKPGGVLIIKGSALFTCDDKMWSGIVVEPGGRIEINDGSTIEDAFVAVNIINNATDEAEFDISKAAFNKNNVAIFIGHEPFSYYPNPLSGTVNNSRFDCIPSAFVSHQFGTMGALNTLKNPLAGERTNTGINVFEVLNGATIGSTNMYLYNTFKNIERGIFITNSSDVSIINNKFDNIRYTYDTSSPWPYPVVENTGICIQSVHGGINVGGSANVANTFQNSSNGIVAKNSSSVTAQYNNFQNTWAPLFYSSRCIYIENGNVNNTNLVEHNTFTNFRNGIELQTFSHCPTDILNNNFDNFERGTGIYCINNTFSNLHIYDNNFNLNSASNNGLTAIRVQNAVLTNSGQALIRGNVIDNCKIGIRATSSSKLEVTNMNQITFTYTEPPASPEYGIWIDNCDGTTIDNNTIQNPGGVLSSDYDGLVFGIAVDANCMGARISNNTTLQLATGMRFSGNNNNPLHVSCNFMTDNRVGMELNNTSIGDQGSSTQAQDNHWYIPSGLLGAINNTSIFPNFYVRSIGLPWFPLPSQMIPSYTLIPGTPIVSGSPYNCFYGCVTPPCISPLFAKIATQQEPYDSLSEENKYLTDKTAYTTIKEDSTYLNLGTPDDAVLNTFSDSVENTNIGIFYLANEKYLAGDTLTAQQLTNSVSPDNFIEENQKTVNQIFYSTWALGNFAFTSEDSLILFRIANMNVDEGGTAVLDARVMLRIDFDDYLIHNSLKTKGTGTVIPVNNGSLFPIPTNDYVYYCCITGNNLIDIELYDAIGRHIIIDQPKLENNMIRLDLSNNAPGIYYYKLKLNGEFIETGRICLIK